MIKITATIASGFFLGLSMSYFIGHIKDDRCVSYSECESNQKNMVENKYVFGDGALQSVDGDNDPISMPPHLFEIDAGDIDFQDI